MPKIPPTFNWGSELKNVNPTLYRQLNDFYTVVAEVVNQKPSTHATKVDPPADSAENINFEIGDFWVNTTTDKAWIMTSRTTNTAVTWTIIT